MTFTYVYKLLTAVDAAQAEKSGVTATALDEGDGYVHLSTSTQVAETARLHYAGKAGTRLLAFPIAALPPLKWEESRGGKLFPHLYGALAIEKATSAWTLPLDDDGIPQVPGDLAK